MAIGKGAKVISLSLGGELQGSVEDDPQCRFIELHKSDAIFVVAVGNSGPKPWTIGTPGAAPDAITVGAWSSHYKSIASFSSRGPQGAWYEDNTETLVDQAQQLGANIYKPDMVAPGGGPGSILVAPPGQIPVPYDEEIDGPPDMILSGVTGWTDGMQDLTPGDGFDFMRGSSMATPLAAGLIAYAYDRGLISSAQEVKDLMAESVVNTPNLMYGFAQDDIPVKDPRVGFGMITLSRLGGNRD